MNVFVDTSGLYAALMSNDRMHEIAAGILRDLLTQPGDLHTTSYVVAETLSLLQRRSGLEAARSFDAMLRPELSVRWVDEDLHARAMGRLSSISNRSIGVVDCASFELMDELGIAGAFAFDAHFEEQGYTLLGR